MSAVTVRGEFGKAICDMMGIDSVIGFKLNTPADGIVTAECEVSLNKAQCDELLTILKRYELHEVEQRDWIDERADGIKADLLAKAGSAKADCNAIADAVLAQLFSSSYQAGHGSIAHYWR